MIGLIGGIITCHMSWVLNGGVDGLLFKYGPDYALRRCLRTDEVFDVIRACHDEPSGRHYSDKRTIHKVLGAGYFWPSMHKDIQDYVTEGIVC